MRYGIKTLVLIGIAGGLIWDAIENNGDVEEKSPLYGLYKVENFVQKGNTLPPSATDTLHWNKLILGSYERARFSFFNDSTRSYACKIDTTNHKIDFTPRNDSTILFSFSYEKPSKDQLIFRGKIQNDTTIVTMKRQDEKDFLLMKRGFRWINEYPFNR